jgi:hypothetical protein
MVFSSLTGFIGTASDLVVRRPIAESQRLWAMMGIYGIQTQTARGQPVHMASSQLVKVEQLGVSK